MFSAMLRTFAVSCAVLGFGLDESESGSLVQKTDVANHFGVQLDEHRLLSGSGGTEGQLSMIELVTQQMMDNPGNWTDAEKGLLEKLREALTKDLEAFLAAEQSSDETDFTTEKEKHEKCITTRNDAIAVSGGVSKAWDVVVETKGKHKACRKSEKTWLDYKDFRSVADSCLNKGDISSLHALAARDVQLLPKLKAVQTNAKEYHDLPPKGTSDACSTDQARFEDQYCAWRTEKHNTCAELGSCVELVGLAVSKNKYLGRQENRIALWGSIQKLKCRVDHMISTFANGSPFVAGTFNKTDNCDTEVNDHSFSLTFGVPEPPDCSKDSGTTAFPSQQDSSECSKFMSQEYNANSESDHSYDLLVHAAVTDCQSTCASATTATTTAIVEVGLATEVNYGDSPFLMSLSAQVPDLDVDLNAATKSWRIEMKMAVYNGFTADPVLWSSETKINMQLNGQTGIQQFGSHVKLQCPRPDMSIPRVYEWGWNGDTNVEYMKYDGHVCGTGSGRPSFGKKIFVCKWLNGRYPCDGRFYYIKVFIDP